MFISPVNPYKYTPNKYTPAFGMKKIVKVEDLDLLDTREVLKYVKDKHIASEDVLEAIRVELTTKTNGNTEEGDLIGLRQQILDLKI